MAVSALIDSGRCAEAGAARDALDLGRDHLLKHLPLVRELRSRDVLRPAKVLPRFLDDPAARARLEALRREKTRVTGLLPSRTRGDR